MTMVEEDSEPEVPLAIIIAGDQMQRAVTVSACSFALFKKAEKFMRHAFQ
jgi:hypothetical protein